MPAELVGPTLRTDRLQDGRRRLVRPLEVKVDGELFTVPECFVTDYSSIPWFGRMLVRWSKVDLAGVVHDWLYATRTCSRAHADKVWRVVAMSGDSHANALQGWVGWLGLRAAGWYVWCKYDRQNHQPVPRHEDDCSHRK